MKIELTSAAFKDGNLIPAKYTCDGEDISPPLRWSALPRQTRSIVVTCSDPDAPGGLFVHWLLYGLSPALSELVENVPKTESVFNGGMHGINGFGKAGYGGPCPPPGAAHHYFFQIYAVDCDLQLKPRATRDELLERMRGHILGEGKLMGTYHRAHK